MISVANSACLYAFHNHTKPDFDLEHYQKIACQNPGEAFFFAKNIPGANIKFCQEQACKNVKFAIWFAKDIPGADIEYCRKACEHDKEWLDIFDKMIIEKAMM